MNQRNFSFSRISPTMRSKSLLFTNGASSSSLSTEFTDLISSNQYDTSKFASLFAERCPSYKLIACNMRGEMRLWVLCLKSLEEEIDEVYVSKSDAVSTLYHLSRILYAETKCIALGCGGEYRYWIDHGEQGRPKCCDICRFCRSTNSYLRDLVLREES